MLGNHRTLASSLLKIHPRVRNPVFVSLTHGMNVSQTAFTHSVGTLSVGLSAVQCVCPRRIQGYFQSRMTLLHAVSTGTLLFWLLLRLEERQSSKYYTTIPYRYLELFYLRS